MINAEELVRLFVVRDALVAKNAEIERLAGELEDAKHRAGTAELNYDNACAAFEALEKENARLEASRRYDQHSDAPIGGMKWRDSGKMRDD